VRGECDEAPLLIHQELHSRQQSVDRGNELM
jgi:hypothetical protein